MRYFTGFLSTSPSVRLSFFVIVVVFLLLFPYLSITSLLLQGDTMSQGQIALVFVSVLLPMLGFKTCIYKLLMPCQGQASLSAAAAAPPRETAAPPRAATTRPTTATAAAPPPRAATPPTQTVSCFSTNKSNN